MTYTPPSSAGLDWLHGLTKNQVALLESMARAMQVPVRVSDTGESDLVDSVFSETTGNLLAVHHALHEEPLNKKAFEYLLKNCLRAQGDSKADLNPTPGAESWDVIGRGTRWSLKTEAAKGITPGQIRIEKLMEARWVREVDSPALCSVEVAARLPRHMQDYDRILILRAFAKEGAMEYVLQEIPKDFLVAAFAAATPDQFSKAGRSISFGADFADAAGAKAFRILLDSSVEKVRLWYQATAAITHGRWLVPVEEARRAQQNSLA